MIKSMTAYGRSLRASSLGELLVEVHSVNKKTLDLHLSLPQEFLYLDLDVRKWVASRLKRGQVTVRISLVSPLGSDKGKLERLRSVKAEMEQLCLAVGCSVQDLSFPFLYDRLKGSITLSKEREELLSEELKKGVEEALEACLVMKQEEGLFLAGGFLERVSSLEAMTSEVEQRSFGAQERYRIRLTEKFAEFKSACEEDKERLAREVFFYAQKGDIAEEIARMRSHLLQFSATLQSQEAVGRTMEFLLQEMGREVNTILSKSDDVDISCVGLKMKGEIEKMKEQAQNIE